MNLQGMQISRVNDQELGMLRTYNSLVLQNQDEAFSLAYDLLGEEGAADTLVQQVFLNGFGRRVDERLPFRLRVMCWIVRACLQRGAHPLSGPGRLDPRLAHLSNEEQVALLLVERLGLNYSEAAAVMEKSVEEFRSLLAAARFSLRKMS